MIEMQTLKSFTGSNKDNFLARVSNALRIVPFSVVDRALNFKEVQKVKVKKWRTKWKTMWLEDVLIQCYLCCITNCCDKDKAYRHFKSFKCYRHFTQK